MATNITIDVALGEDINHAIRRFRRAMERTGMRPDMARKDAHRKRNQQRTRKQFLARLRRHRQLRTEARHYQRWLVRESWDGQKTAARCPPDVTEEP